MFDGTTLFGGGGTVCSSGCGTVFKVDPKGNETILHRFTAGKDGFGPSGVIRDADGNLYVSEWLIGGCYSALRSAP